MTHIDSPLDLPEIHRFIALVYAWGRTDQWLDNIRAVNPGRFADAANRVAVDGFRDLYERMASEAISQEPVRLREVLPKAVSEINSVAEARGAQANGGGVVMAGFCSECSQYGGGHFPWCPKAAVHPDEHCGWRSTREAS